LVTGVQTCALPISRRPPPLTQSRSLSNRTPEARDRLQRQLDRRSGNLIYAPPSPRYAEPMRIVLLTAALVAGVVCHAAERAWQTGTWGDVSTRRQMIDFGPGSSSFGPPRPGVEMRALADVSVYVIETDTLRIAMGGTPARLVSDRLVGAERERDRSHRARRRRFRLRAGEHDVGRGRAREVRADEVMARTFLLIGALGGVVGVALGAFGAHGLRGGLG